MSLRRVMDELEEELYGPQEGEAELPLSAVDGLLSGLARKSLLELLKSEKEATSRIFRGFKVGPAALRNPLVRGRLAEELENNEKLRGRVLAAWRKGNADLCRELESRSLGALREELPQLVEGWGGGALWLGLASDRRKTATRLLRAASIDWSASSPEQPAPGKSAKPAKAAPAPKQPRTRTDAELLSEMGALRTQNTELTKKTTRLQSARDRARSEARKWQREYESVQARLTHANAAAERLTGRLERLERQRDRLEETVASAERELRRLRRVAGAAGGAEPETEVVQAPPPPKPTPKRSPRSRVPGLVWQEGSRKYSVPLSEVLKAVFTNNVSLVKEWAESLRSLAHTDRDRFRRVRQEIAGESAYCAHVLTRSTQGVVVDGSNVCHYEHDGNGRAKLANLQTARDELREHRFFPVLIQIDASLPYQIDEPEKLSELVERGEIRMVVAGTSADDEITRIARDNGYYVVTNDRGLTKAIDPELDLPVLTYSIEQGYFYCHE